jgi:VCBS repeat-containing protein
MFYSIGLSRLKVQTIIAFGVIGVWHSVQGQVVANNDFYIAPEGSVFTVSAPGVLANDTGGSGNLTAILASGPANGTLTLNANGSFAYTPTNNFTGVDSFTYQASDGSLTSSVATVDIMVVAPGELFCDNFARPTSSGSIFPWMPVSDITGWAPVLGTWGITNKLLIGHSPFSSYGYAYFNTNWTDYSVQAQIRFAANNAASAGLLGRLNATSTNSSHYDVWIYPEESTEALGSGTGTALLRLFKHESWTTYIEIGNPITLPGVGVDWHTVKLTFKGNNISAYFDGILELSVTDDGSLDGYPAYTNGGIGLNMWTQPPAAYAFSVANLLVSTTNTIANYDTYNATTNTTLRVIAPGILANDAGNAPLTATLVGNPTHGSLTLTNNGGFSYTPTNSFSGTDSFTYQCSDGQTTSRVATVTITVNNLALANNDAYSMSANKTLSLGPPGILANDQGGTGPLTAILDSGPADGSLTLATNGGFSYTPMSGFIGTDSFTYQCRDSQSTSQVATATINVVTAEPAPVILSLGLTNNMVAITWSSVASLIYQLQRTDSLNGTNWTNVSPNLTASGPTTTETNTVGNAPQQFYRINLLTP